MRWNCPSHWYVLVVILVVVAVLGSVWCAREAKATEEASQREAELREVCERTVPVCADEADCELKWGAAQRWVVSKVPWRIRLVTDTLIETYGYSNYRCGNPAATWALVAKVPTPDGRMTIRITMQCYFGVDKKYAE